MDINEFLDDFAGEMDDTKRSDISGETKFKELVDWSSLTALSIIAMIDDKYEVSVLGADMRNSNTIGDLFALVKDRKNG